MAEDTIVLLEKGTGKSEAAKDIEIPDLWHLAMWLKHDAPKNERIAKHINPAWGDMVIDTWHKAHAMREHILSGI